MGNSDSFMVDGPHGSATYRSEQLDGSLRRLAEDLDHVPEPFLVELAPDLPLEAVGCPIHGDEPEEMLEPLQGLLGVLHQAEIEPESAVIPDAVGVGIAGI